MTEMSKALPLNVLFLIKQDIGVASSRVAVATDSVYKEGYV